MLLNDGRTTSIPRSLALAAAIFMVTRIAVLAFERMHPPIRKEYVQWISAENIPAKPDPQKLYLLWFTADWCGPCKQLEQAAFQNKDVIDLINQKFIPLKIVDRKQEDGKNNNKVQVLEGQFHLYIFPTLVVALPDDELDRVEVQVGGVSAKSTLSFMQRAIKNAPYKEGMRTLVEGRWTEAVNQLSKWLKQSSWSDDRSTYAALFLSAAYINNHDEDNARQILKEAWEKSKHSGWPHALLGYLDGSKEKIIEVAEEDHDQLLDSHYFAGILSLSKSDTKGARSEFEWVKQHGTKEQYAFELSLVQLKTLDADKSHVEK